MTILAPPDIRPPQPVDAVLETLAAYVAAYGLDVGGHQRTILIAALLTARHGLPPAEAVELAHYGIWDDRVDACSRERDELLERARRVWEETEYGPAQGADDASEVTA
jgi:hypothetical protein